MNTKEQLKSLIDAIVNKNHESAQVTFHNFLQDKMQNILHPTSDVEPGKIDDPKE